MVAASMLLWAYGSFVGSGATVALLQPITVAWPLAMLPAECDAMVWAGAHGLVMSSLALLPHSPSGQAVLQSLVGQQSASRASQVSSYAYCLLGLAAMAFYGAGWVQLPFWWSLIMINFGPTELPPPPLEEKSEVPLAATVLGYVSLASAILYIYPWPLHELF
mmetsp:Transcript_8767/g.22581  ORF Transcript_8767/g.22581 Transcript_8767/m.22581 type:complete len:163 (+) Transcript_8767:1-489(+)